MAVPSSWVLETSLLVGRGVDEVVRGDYGWESGVGARLAHPAREALSDGLGLLRRTWPGAAVDRGRHGAHQPRVDRQALAGRGLLGAGLEVARQPQVDAGDTALVAVGRSPEGLGGCGRLLGARS